MEEKVRKYNAAKKGKRTHFLGKVWSGRDLKVGLRKLPFCLIPALLREQNILYMPVNKEDSKRFLTASQILTTNCQNVG